MSARDSSPSSPPEVNVTRWRRSARSGVEDEGLLHVASPKKLVYAVLKVQHDFSIVQHNLSSSTTGLTMRKEDMKPIHILVREGEREVISEFATSKGYKTAADYIRELIEKDMRSEGREIDLTVKRGRRPKED